MNSRRYPKFIIFLITLFCWSVVAISHATPPAGYTLTWSDEFNGAAGTPPNPANWGYDTGAGGWGNSELENYTNNIANAQIVGDPAATDGSSLAIISIDTNPVSTVYNTVGRYTSARINSAGKQSFQYGWMEANIKVPYGQGIWPAYWMLGTNIGSVGWPACGETDIMEQIGSLAYQGRNYGSLHSPGYNSSSNIYNLPAGQYFKNAYHTFSVLWQADQVQFYVDDILYETETNANVTAAGGTWAFNHPFFFILNSAVGGTFPGNPNGTTSFPQTMLVDYVRVYQYAGPTFTPTTTATPTVTPTPAATLRVNCGGPAYTDSLGKLWSADAEYTGGTAASTTNSITGTSDPTLYKTERYGSTITYTFTVLPGSYQVTLKFAEIYWTAVGKRIFNVSINGNPVLTNFDIFADAGGVYIADDKVFHGISPDGSSHIVVQFTAGSADVPKVSAIEVLPEPATPTPTATSTPTSTPINTPTITATTSPTATPTSTPVIVGKTILGPNPVVDGRSSVDLWIPLPAAPADIHVRIFTLAFRLVRDLKFDHVSSGSLPLAVDLHDKAGAAFANGLYYVKVEGSTDPSATKLLILR